MLRHLSDSDSDEDAVVDEDEDNDASQEGAPRYPTSDSSGDEGEVEVDADSDDETPEVTERRLRAHVNRVVLLRSTVIGKHFFSDQDDQAMDEDSLTLDAYGAFEANDEGDERMRMLAKAIEVELSKEWNAYDPQYANTYEDEKLMREQFGENHVSDVTTPLVHAHNPPPACEVCFCCKSKTACAYQMPEEVFMQAADTNPGFGIECVKEMAQLLLAGNNAEVRRRTACCRTVDCMLAQKVLKYECYEAWVISLTSRTQLERGTDRKDQGLTFGENVIFLRTLAVMSPSPLSEEELFALFKWLVLHSQWIQEREKRFIATAMCVANNPHVFGYTFAKKQRFVDRMGSFVRRYALNVIFPHIMDTASKQGTNHKRWKSTANCLLETGMPKAPDVVYALLCQDNWEAWGEPKDADGRYEHRVPRGNPDSAALFTREGFEEALTRCTHTKTGRTDPKTGKEVLAAIACTLSFASEAEAGGSAGMAAAGVSSNKRTETHKLHKKIAGSHRKLWTVGHAVAAAPTCGSAQANSGVHPRDRNENCWRAFDHDRAEAKALTDLYMQDHENGNTVGHEKQSANKDKSKACTVIRPITAYVPPPVKQFNPTRSDNKYKCTNTFIPVRLTKHRAQ